MNADGTGAEGTGGTEFEQQLSTEERECPSCHLRVRNPLLERCPRCITPLPRSLADCGNCTHQGGCEFARAVPAKKRKS